jgi:hypothetical protein
VREQIDRIDHVGSSLHLPSSLDDETTIIGTALADG